MSLIKMMLVMVSVAAISKTFGLLRFLRRFVTGSSGRRGRLTDRRPVWLTLRYNHPLAIVDRSAAGPNQFVRDETRLRVVPGDRIRAFDAAGRVVDLTIVGVLEQALQFTPGAFVDQEVVRAGFPPQKRDTPYLFPIGPAPDPAALPADLRR